MPAGDERGRKVLRVLSLRKCTGRCVGAVVETGDGERGSTGASAPASMF